MNLLRPLLCALAVYAEWCLVCPAYSFQTFTVGQVLTASQVNQLEVNVRDHQHGVSSVFNQAATQADLEAAASVLLYTTPGRQQFHPSAVKFFVKANVAGAIQGTANNVTSITDVGTGALRVTIATDFSSADWVSHHGIQAQAALSVMVDSAAGTPQAAGTVDYVSRNTVDSAADPVMWYASGVGDQ